MDLVVYFKFATFLITCHIYHSNFKSQRARGAFEKSVWEACGYVENSYLHLSKRRQFVHSWRDILINTHKVTEVWSRTLPAYKWTRLKISLGPKSIDIVARLESSRPSRTGYRGWTFGAYSNASNRSQERFTLLMNWETFFSVWKAYFFSLYTQCSRSL